MRKTVFAALTAAAFTSLADGSSLSFDAGGSIRVRQEIMHNVPAAQNGYLGRPGVARGKTKNQIRFRPSVWVELKDADKWRVYDRVTDEFRAGIVQKTHSQTFPGELVLDNLFFEGKGFFDGFLDVVVGRQDIYRLYGLNHIFVDGTPGDGS